MSEKYLFEFMLYKSSMLYISQYLSMETAMFLKELENFQNKEEL